MSEEQDPQYSSLDEESSDCSEQPKNVKPTTSKLFKNPFYNKEKRTKPENPDMDSSDPNDSSANTSDSDSYSESRDDSDEGSEDEIDNIQSDEEDSVIKAIKAAREKGERKVPHDLKSKDHITDISFHPKTNLIAYCTIEGQLNLHEYNNETNVLKKKSRIHKGSVRSLEFDTSGKYIVSGGEDRSFQIIDMETLKTQLKVPEAHSSSMYKVKPLNENLLATGDEDGTVKLWDKRHHNASKPVMEDSESLTNTNGESISNAITDFFYDADIDSKYLVASSEGGVIQGYNLAGKKPDIQSVQYEGGLNTMGVVHRNSKLVVGCEDGKLFMFNTNDKQYGEHADQFPGHPECINSLVAVTDNVIITASDSIRAVHLYPHRFIGTVGHHENKHTIERLDVSYDGELIASISHDECVKFWNIKYLEDMDYNKTKKPFHQQKTKIRRKESKMQQAKEAEFQLPSSTRGNRKDFFKELE